MSEFFERNGELIQRRWPKVWHRLSVENSAALHADLVEGLGSTLSIDGIQLTSRHDRTREALLQADSLPVDSPVVHVYGTGLGDLQLQLLERAGLERLYVHILNGAVFALVLQLLDQQPWLGDSRVVLLYAGDLAEIQLPFFALPSELVLADDFNAKIRDRLISETHLTFNNRDFAADNPQIAERLQACVERVRADADAAELFATCSGREVFVIGTGPTLEQHFDTLRTLREQALRPLFICVDTATGHLSRMGSDRMWWSRSISASRRDICRAMTRAISRWSTCLRSIQRFWEAGKASVTWPTPPVLSTRICASYCPRPNSLSVAV